MLKVLKLLPFSVTWWIEWQDLDNRFVCIVIYRNILTLISENWYKILYRAVPLYFPLVSLALPSNWSVNLNVYPWDISLSSLFSLSLSLRCTRRSSPPSSPRSTLRCSFRPPAFSTFVNVVVLSSDPLVARISKRLITRHLTAVVIYNFHYIIRAVPLN